MTPHLYIVRHGLPVRVVDSPKPDPRLSAVGFEQAADVAKTLADRGVAEVVASDLLRAQQTAAPLAAQLGLNIVIDPAVAEFDLGADFYIPVEEMIREEDPRLARWREVMLRDEVKLLQAEFASRCVSALAALAERAEEGPVAVFTHGGVIESLTEVCVGMPDPCPPATYASITSVRLDRGQWHVVALAETAHLRTVIGNARYR